MLAVQRTVTGRWALYVLAPQRRSIGYMLMMGKRDVSLCFQLIGLRAISRRVNSRSLLYRPACYKKNCKAIIQRSYPAGAGIKVSPKGKHQKDTNSASFDRSDHAEILRRPCSPSDILFRHRSRARSRIALGNHGK